MRNGNDPELVRMALDLLPQGVLVCDAGGAILFRNQEVTRSLPRGDHVSAVLRGGNSTKLDWAGDVASLQAEPGGLVRRNISLDGAGGRRVLADVYLRLLPWSAAEVPAEEQGGPTVLVVVQDISLRASAERRLAVSERLAAQSKVAAKAAHELNNPLDGVLRYIGLAERVLEGQGGLAGQASEHLARARDGALRMAGILHDMLDEQTGPRETLGKLLDDAIVAFAPRAEALGVTVACDLGDGGDTPADGQLFQVFCNIIKNALDAMPGGGVLSIRRITSRDRCTLEFADTGCGLATGQAEQVFEPFYTTKPAGEGVGLGLSVSREILTAIGGTITAAPRAQGGAAITLTLPMRCAAAARKGG